MIETHYIHEAHEHHDHHADDEPVISQRWKWMAVLGNAAIGISELATGNLSTMSVTSDGLHNVGDTATYYMQAENILDPNKSEQKKMRLRKIAHWVIAATSLGVSAKAGVDLSLDHESTPHVATMYAAGASLALNGMMLARLRRGIRRKRESHESVYERDLSKHFWAVDIPSASLAVAGATLQRYNVDIEQVAAVASGVVGAYAFRPTRANLAHNCLDHDHAVANAEHAHNHEHHHREPEAPCKKGWLARMTYEPRHGQERQAAPSRLRLAMGLGTTALALVAGVISGDTRSADTVHATPDAARGPVAVDTQPDAAQKPQRKPKVLPVTECVTIQPGDSQWKIVKRRVVEATGKQPSIAVTNAITMFTAAKNKAAHPVPDAIDSGDCLYVPTLAATRILYGAIEQPQTSDSQLVTDIRSFNERSNTQDMMDNDTKAAGIDSYLQRALVAQGAALFLGRQ
jgi:hypothetical protein